MIYTDVKNQAHSDRGHASTASTVTGITHHMCLVWDVNQPSMKHAVMYRLTQIAAWTEAHSKVQLLEAMHPLTYNINDNAS